VNIRRSIRKDLNEGHDPATRHQRVWVSLYDRQEEETRPERLEQDVAIIGKAANDPSPIIRRMAPALLKGREDALHALNP